MTASCAILRSVSGRSLPERPAGPPNLGRRFFGDIAARHGRTCARWRRDRTAPRGSSVENGSRRRRGVPRGYSAETSDRGDAGGVPRGIFRGRAKALRKVSRAVARTARSFIASERRASNMAATVASQRRTSRSHVATNTTVATGDGSASGYRASGRSRALATRCSQSATKDRRSFRKLPSRDASSRSSRRGTMTNSSSRPWMPETGVIANALAARRAASFSCPSVGKRPPPSNLRKSRCKGDGASVPSPAGPRFVTTDELSSSSHSKSQAARFCSSGPAQTSLRFMSLRSGNISSGCGAANRTCFAGLASACCALARRACFLPMAPAEARGAGVAADRAAIVGWGGSFGCRSSRWPPRASRGCPPGDGRARGGDALAQTALRNVPKGGI